MLIGAKTILMIGTWITVYALQSFVHPLVSALRSPVIGGITAERNRDEVSKDHPHCHGLWGFPISGSLG